MKSQAIFRQNIKKSIQRSLSWTILTTLLGLIQLWITICVSYVLTHISYSMWGALQEGALLFFIMAVTTAITVDYHFTSELRISQSIRGIMFTVFPFMIGVFVSGLYVALYISDPSKVNRPALVLIQCGIITLTIIYALIAKAIMFFHEETYT